MAAAISKAEYYLSIGAIVPILGTVPALLKMGMGCIQMITGLAIAIIFAIPACFSKRCREIFRIGVAHFVHGGGNILVGFLEAIPIIGTVVAVIGLKKARVMLRNDAATNPGGTFKRNAEGEYVRQQPIENEEYYRVRFIIDEPCGKFLVYRDLLSEFATIRLEKRTGNTTIESEVLEYDDAKEANIPFEQVTNYWIAV